MLTRISCGNTKPIRALITVIMVMPMPTVVALPRPLLATRKERFKGNAV